MIRRNSVVLALFLLACAGSRSTPEAHTELGAGSEAASKKVAPSGLDEPHRSPGGLLRSVVVRADPDSSGPFAIVVENHGREAEELSTAVILEKEDGAAWTEAGAAGIRLRDSCAAPAPPCLTLAPGASVHAPSWTGAIGEAQCACDECARALPGRYRFVLETCDHRARVEGEAFDLVR